jgi:protein gp37
MRVAKRRELVAMADQREGGIAWCDESWNPIRGCSRVSPGCENCYAERTAARFSDYGQPYYGLAVRKLKTLGEDDEGARTVPRWTGQVRFVPEHLGDPLKWKRPRRIFVNSMSDLFHEKLDVRDVDQIFAVMALSPRHVFQVLTKRAPRMKAYLNDPEVWARIEVAARRIHRDRTGEQIGGKTLIGPLPNVWLGVTAEDQQRADERIPLLLETPAAVRFVSVEPQLEHVQLKPFTVGAGTYCHECGGAGVKIDEDGCCTSCGADATWFGVDWIICGAESGHGARPFDPDWARSLRDQCTASGAAFFYKQIVVGGQKISTPELDGRRWTDFPEVR